MFNLTCTHELCSFANPEVFNVIFDFRSSYATYGCAAFLPDTSRWAAAGRPPMRRTGRIYRFKDDLNMLYIGFK
eukprot:2941393-Heterocapsa_arctica.AAC.1